MLWICGTERIGTPPSHRIEPLRLQVGADPPRLLRALQSGNPARLVMRWGVAIGDEVRAEQVREAAATALAAAGHATHVRGGWIAASEAAVITACVAAAERLGVRVVEVEVGAPASAGLQSRAAAGSPQASRSAPLEDSSGHRAAGSGGG